MVAARCLTDADVPSLAEAPICVEDVERIAGDTVAEEALFHLHNLVLAEGGHLLITASDAPARWGLQLPDLRSRLDATTLATLAPPDDALLAAVIVKLFADRQITVTGRKLATTLDEGVIVQGRDGVIWGVDRKELVSHTTDERPFKPLTPEELADVMDNVGPLVH